MNILGTSSRVWLENALTIQYSYIHNYIAIYIYIAAVWQLGALEMLLAWRQTENSSLTLQCPFALRIIHQYDACKFIISYWYRMAVVAPFFSSQNSRGLPLSINSEAHCFFTYTDVTQHCLPYNVFTKQTEFGPVPNPNSNSLTLVCYVKSVISLHLSFFFLLLFQLEQFRRP